MAKSKFKAGDKVRILANELQPQFEGRAGVIKKVFQTFCEGNFLYRIEVAGETLRGMATDSDLEAV